MMHILKNSETIQNLKLDNLNLEYEEKLIIMVFHHQQEK